ncbi:30S ribosomal protein S16 [Lyticum sinuosum]|uniref:30S ribosomal protein S16 n=1 Tax=Lyticum sinuosum TaxID=1332059 RepID=A0AAE4VKK9_9RICK|nr:30S ribosomal protein S16 [Lyticum sinuosum]MDZ5761562.1 30S ribosomal protein S16 [Lyticum sinuosum]
MPVKIILHRLGRKKRPFYRIVVSSSKKNGQLGYYDPFSIVKGGLKKVVLDTEKFSNWIKNGAQPTESVARLVRKIDPNLLPKKMQVPHYMKKQSTQL